MKSSGLVALTKENDMSIEYLFARVNLAYLFIVILLLTSCNNDIESIQTKEMMTPELVESIPTSTATIRPTNPPNTPQPTHTPIPDTPTPTLTAIPLTNTPTPLPTATLTNEQIGEKLTELMLTNAGCQLPCWWGITPGETQLDLARDNLATLGASIVGSSSLSMGVDWGIFIEFEVSNSLVQTLDIYSSYISGRIDRDKYTNGWQPYKLMAVLDRYGPPTRVLVYYPFAADPSPPAYHLLVFYEELGIEIDYTGSVEILGEDRYRACLDMADIWIVHLFLYQPGYVEDVVERVLPASSISYIADPETVHETISWQQATGTTLESFYETFQTTEANSCFEFETPEWSSNG
jgi:hypothetical protein